MLFFIYLIFLFILLHSAFNNNDKIIIFLYRYFILIQTHPAWMVLRLAMGKNVRFRMAENPLRRLAQNRQILEELRPRITPMPLHFGTGFNR